MDTFPVQNHIGGGSGTIWKTSSSTAPDMAQLLGCGRQRAVGRGPGLDLLPSPDCRVRASLWGSGPGHGAKHEPIDVFMSVWMLMCTPGCVCVCVCALVCMPVCGVSVKGYV